MVSTVAAYPYEHFVVTQETGWKPIVLWLPVRLGYKLSSTECRQVFADMYTAS